MDVAALRRLVRMMEEEGLVELEVEDAAGRVRLVRAAVATAAGSRASRGGRRRAPSERPGPGPDASPAAGSVGEEIAAILSPMVGTFYRAPAPGAAAFVEVGESISAGQVVCIVEAMKMMNEVRAELSGRIVRVLAEDGAAVEYGSPLFAIEPIG